MPASSPETQPKRRISPTAAAGILAARDPERSKELLARARDLEGLAARAADTKVDLNLLLEDFNDNQMRKRDSS